MLLGQASAAQDINAASSFLKTASIIQGDANTGDLRLDAQINRAELMKILVNAATTSVDPFEFRDCLADINAEWFARYVCWAVQNNYVQGYPDGAFHAGNSVNRAEALKLISEVFHLDYQRMAPVADSNVWYDIYVRNAQRQHIIDMPLTNEQLAQPVTRGEVFDYLFRAMAVSAGASDTFTDSEYQSFPTEFLASRNADSQPRTLTPAETALLQTLRAQINYGFQPVSGTGSSMMHVTGSGMGMSFDVRGDVNEQSKVDGTATAIKGMNDDLQLTLDVKSKADDAISFKTVADISIAGSGSTMMYFRLNNLEMVDVQAPIEAKMELDAAMQEVNNYKNIWYSVDLASLGGDMATQNPTNMYQMAGLAAVDFLEKSMKSSSQPYFDIIQDGNDAQATILIKPNADRMQALVENIVMGVSPETNRYMVRQIERTFDSTMDMFAKNVSVMLTYDKANNLLRKFAAVMDPVTIELPSERTKFTTEFAIEEYYNYDKDFEIQIPVQSTDILKLLNGDTTGSGETMNQ